MDADKYNILLTLMQENKADLTVMRESNHRIGNEMHRISGQFELLRQDLNNQKNDNKERFDIVHARVDKEREAVRLLLEHQANHTKSIETTVKEIAPKVSSMSKVFDWATRLVITALVGGILWATVQAYIIKQ